MHLFICCPSDFPHLSPLRARHQGVYYLHDPRLQNFGNTVDSPASDVVVHHTTKKKGYDSTCPNVPKTFLNARSCKTTQTCSQTLFTSTPILLNKAALRVFFTKGGHRVHYITGLRLETGFYLKPPCQSPGRRARWRKMAPTEACNATVLDDALADVYATSIRNSGDQANPYVRDTLITPAQSAGVCKLPSAELHIVTVLAGGVCWEYVHPHLYNVYDFTQWSTDHVGNTPAFKPIKRIADHGGVHLHFPASHEMGRWFYTHKDNKLPLLGRLGDTANFALLPTAVQSLGAARAFGSVQEGETSSAIEACGSPGEVANDPRHGHKYLYGMSRAQAGAWGMALNRLPSEYAQRSMVHTMHSLYANDQLRQRVAWAYAQIIVVGQMQGLDRKVEPWLVFYDILVRNAFGNFRDLLKEVSFSPLMGLYLSFLNSKSFDASGSAPDENFAREIMQLFSIGLWELNEDGTRVLDAESRPIPTYGTPEIMSLAKVWTGFVLQADRANYEYAGTNGNQNYVDPMKIKAAHRDSTPKMNLYSGHIGDHYPLCADVPTRAFLRIGAKFRLLSGNLATMQPDWKPGPGEESRQPRLVLGQNSSALHKVLCGEQGPAGEGCRLRSEIVLAANLACDGTECTVDTVLVVGVVDANRTVYYEYIRQPCVELAFYTTGFGVEYYTNGGSSDDSKGWHSFCADPTIAVAAGSCCIEHPQYGDKSRHHCEYMGERLTVASARQRCARFRAKHGLTATGQLCPPSFGGLRIAQGDPTCIEPRLQYMGKRYWWTETACTLKAQITDDGLVNFVDTLRGEELNVRTVHADSGNTFRVRWRNGAFPVAASKCAGAPACKVHGKTCVCTVDVATNAVFTTLSDVPRLTADTVESELFVGSVPPTHFDEGVYSECTSKPCMDARANGVVLYTTGSALVPVMDATTIFRVVVNVTTERYLANKVSTVSVAGGSFEFRNPPNFMSHIVPTQRDAEFETEALIEHIFNHRSAAPFIARRLIQRLVTSNPSPRYVHAVVRAFKTGTYLGKTFSGKYGDLGATMAAIMLDREARSTVLDADPSNGQLREPWLKLMHLMRAFEYQPNDGREVELRVRREHDATSMVHVIGMGPYDSPSVFNFYLPEYSPAGAVSMMKLISPETQLGTLPNVVGFLNGVTSLIQNGLILNDKGFAGWNLNMVRQRLKDSDPKYRPDGRFAYVPTNASSAEATIAEVSLLLTSGRLSQEKARVISDAYARTRAMSGDADALKVAQQLIMTTAEFQSTNNAGVRAATAKPLPPQLSLGRPYKAIVVVYLSGGADTYNMLMPHSRCSGADLAKEYSEARDVAAIPRSMAIPIDVPPGTQPCDVFAVNRGMPHLKRLYDEGDAAFVANVGALIEPVTKATYDAGTVQLPPSLYGHNTQDNAAWSLHPQNLNADGVLGRMMAALDSQEGPGPPLKTSLYSVAGLPKIVVGGRPPIILDSKKGVPTFDENTSPASVADILQLGANESSSIFAETANNMLRSSLRESQRLAKTLATAKLTNTQWPSSTLADQLKQVARVVASRKSLEAERDVFFVKSSGWDMHGDVVSKLTVYLSDVDKALEAFTKEIKGQGVWDDVVIPTFSEFGRTLTSNGQGTDHGWAGHQVMMGGSIKGAQIHGKYPSSLNPENNQLLVGGTRARVVPTSPWEAMWLPMAEWFGVQPKNMARVLPNLKNFNSSQLLTARQVFQS